jgi:hypothetical protein
MTELTIPDSHFNVSREHMPQIKSDLLPIFLDHLKRTGITWSKKRVDPNSLSATQGEFNTDKIKTLMQNSNSVTAVIISKDNYILDGHHRWLADLNSDQKTNVIMVDLPILDLISTAKSFDGVFYKDVTEQRVRTIKTIIKEGLKQRKIL